MSPVIPAKNPWRLAAVGVVLALMVAGCGRKGALELPPTAAQPTETGVVERSTEVPPAEPVQPPENANRRFILDGLL